MEKQTKEKNTAKREKERVGEAITKPYGKREKSKKQSEDERTEATVNDERKEGGKEGGRERKGW